MAFCEKQGHFQLMRLLNSENLYLSDQQVEAFPVPSFHSLIVMYSRATALCGVTEISVHLIDFDL